jgi:hypothetical protein
MILLEIIAIFLIGYYFGFWTAVIIFILGLILLAVADKSR